MIPRSMEPRKPTVALKRPRSTFATVSGVMWVAGVLILVFLVSLQLAPSVIEQRRDSGIFAYTGKVILEGGQPYSDAWDNKLPGVYLIDALAFVLFGTNRWALWLIENITLVLAGLVMFWLLQQLYRNRAEAWMGTIILVILARHPGLVSDVNFTEPYALLPQVIVLAAGYQFLRRPSYRLAFVIGFASGAAFLIKQTTVGVALTFIPAILLTRHPVMRSQGRWSRLGVIVLGGLTILGLMAIYLLANGILDNAIDASFVAASAFHHWVGEQSAWIGETVFVSLTSSDFPAVFGPLLPFLGIGMVAAVRRSRSYVRQNRQLPTARQNRRLASEATLLAWAVLAFFADLGLANVTGRGYSHYYVPLLPSSVLLITLSILVVRRYGARPERGSRLIAAGLQLYLGTLLLGVSLGASLFRFYMVNWDIAGPERERDVVAYVMEHTEPDQTVLVWGVDTVINFQSGRDSPTEYTYGYPLVVPGYTTDEDIQDVVHDLERNRPALIIDTTLRDGDRVPPLDPVRREQWWAAGGRQDIVNLDPIFNFVSAHCRTINEIDQAVIYHCRYQLAGDGPFNSVAEPFVEGMDTFWGNLGIDVKHGLGEVYNDVSLGVY